MDTKMMANTKKKLLLTSFPRIVLEVQDNKTYLVSLSANESAFACHEKH